MLIALAPALLTAVAFTEFKIDWVAKCSAATLIYGVLSLLLSFYSRQAGQVVEARLKTKWKGVMPSVMILRHRDDVVDAITKARVHKVLAKVVAGSKAPTAAQETQYPDECDVTYRAWSEHLRITARVDSSKFPHVSNENTQYGFMRNLRGLKPFALFVLILCLGASVGLFILSGSSWHQVETTAGICWATLLCLVPFWTLAVNDSRVERAAWTYARRLIDDCVPKSSTKT